MDRGNYQRYMHWSSFCFLVHFQKYLMHDLMIQVMWEGNKEITVPEAISRVLKSLRYLLNIQAS